MLYIVIVIHQHHRCRRRHRRRHQSQVIRNVQFNHETKNEKVNRLEKCKHLRSHRAPNLLLQHPIDSTCRPPLRVATRGR